MTLWCRIIWLFLSDAGCQLDEEIEDRISCTRTMKQRRSPSIEPRFSAFTELRTRWWKNEEPRLQIYHRRSFAAPWEWKVHKAERSWWEGVLYRSKPRFSARRRNRGHRRSFAAPENERFTKQKGRGWGKWYDEKGFRLEFAIASKLPSCPYN